MWQEKKVSVIFPTYREKASIKRVISEFWRSGYADEIVVVNNNAEPGTNTEVRKTKARLIYERRQGYGHAIRAGLRAARGDLLIVAEPDGSFDGRDVIKLLAYSDDFDMVFGSRTHVPLVGRGSDMTLFKRIGDVLLGKLVTALFLCAPLSDLGCTLRITTKKAWKRIEKYATAPDNIFAAEWVLCAAKLHIHFMEIPIHYKSRMGRSTATDTLKKQLIWGARKFLLIWKVWLTSNTHRQRLAKNEMIV